MAVRTTAEAVRAVIEVDDDIALTDDSGLDPFIEVGNLIVNQVCVPVKKADGTPYYVGDVELEIIERWLSAHFYAVRDPRVQFEGVKNLMTRYESKVEYFLKNTRYGQAAMLADTSGALAQYDKMLENKAIRRKPSLHWGGTPADE